MNNKPAGTTHQEDQNEFIRYVLTCEPFVADTTEGNAAWLNAAQGASPALHAGRHAGMYVSGALQAANLWCLIRRAVE